MTDYALTRLYANIANFKSPTTEKFADFVKALRANVYSFLDGKRNVLEFKNKVSSKESLLPHILKFPYVTNDFVVHLNKKDFETCKRTLTRLELDIMHFKVTGTYANTNPAIDILISVAYNNNCVEKSFNVNSESWFYFAEYIWQYACSRYLGRNLKKAEYVVLHDEYLFYLGALRFHNRIKTLPHNVSIPCKFMWKM